MSHRFTNDYSEIAHPRILAALSAAGSEQNPGYGHDGHSSAASDAILKEFSAPDGQVFFLTGGTQTNATVISFLLKPYEAVIACDTGHINVHETGAVEGTGHKVLTCPNHNGKLAAADAARLCRLHCDEHMVHPGMIYISDSTETGTVYTASELRGIRRVCDEFGLYLFIDGARLGAALTSEGNDVTPAILSEVCDVFYVGGTKNGLLYGEAVVFTHKELAERFSYHIKNRGSMLAKGFIPGIMFGEAFKDGLYWECARNSNRTAAYIRESLKDTVKFCGTSNTNQIFIELDKDRADRLIEAFGVEFWGEGEGGDIVRIVTSFATAMSDCDELIAYIKELVK